MTDEAIQRQIMTIRNATKKAMVSKEAALKFLSEAGIFLEEKKVKRKKKK